MRERRYYTPDEGVEWGKSVVIAIIIAFLIKTFIFNSTLVMGSSMEPTLHPSDRLFAEKISIYLKKYDRGDIIVLKAPDEDKKDYIKRIIGLEGDKVEIKDGQVYINNELLLEDYILEDSYTHSYGEISWLVPEGEVFVLGDNRDDGASKDSRVFGTISVDSIKAVTCFRYYPFDKSFGKIN